MKVLEIEDEDVEAEKKDVTTELYTRNNLPPANYCDKYRRALAKGKALFNSISLRFIK